MTWKLYVLMSGGGAVAAYALSLTSPFAPPARVAEPRVAPAPPAAAVDIGALADGLHVRMDVERRYRAPARDAFNFGGTQAASRASEAAVEAPVPIAIPLPPPAPPFGLFGVMTGENARTAMLSSLGGITLAGEGDTVGGWRVVEVAPSSVTLESIDGTRATLSLFGAGLP